MWVGDRYGRGWVVGVVPSGFKLGGGVVMGEYRAARHGDRSAEGQAEGEVSGIPGGERERETD